MLYANNSGIFDVIAPKKKTKGRRRYCFFSSSLYILFVSKLFCDLIWAQTLFSSPCRCHLVDVLVEMDRILRPEGTAIIRDRPDVIKKVTSIAHAIRWTTKVYESEPESNNSEKILVARKTFWKLPWVFFCSFIYFSNFWGVSCD